LFASVWPDQYATGFDRCVTRRRLEPSKRTRAHLLLVPAKRGLAFTQQRPPLGPWQLHHRLHRVDPRPVILAQLGDKVARTRRLDQPEDEVLIAELVMQTVEPASTGSPLERPLAVASRGPDICHRSAVLTVLTSELTRPLEHRLNLRPTGHRARAVRILPTLHCLQQPECE
jgi:hypothetical protein